MADVVRATKGRGAVTAVAERGHSSKGRAGGAYRGHLKSGRRDVRVNVSLSEVEAAAVKAAASAADQTPSAWLAEVGVTVATNTAPEGQNRVEVSERELAAVAAREQMLALGRLRAQLASIGNNVNQIARGVNAGQPVEAAQAGALWSYIRENVDRLDGELDRLRAAAGR